METDPTSPLGTAVTLGDTKDHVELASVTQMEDALNKTANGIAMHEQHAKTPEERKRESRFVLKIDLIIFSLLATTYFLASLDRADVGNAAVLGMTQELQLSPQQLSTCISIFYVSYILLQLPSFLGLKLIPPPLQVGAALVMWGMFNSLICTAKNYATVAGLRVGVGAGEAVLQAAPLYLSFWYKRDELATRGAFFFAASAIAGAFNGTISYGIAKNLSGVNGWEPWRWLFLIEGILSVAWGLVVFALLPPLPEKPWWGFSKEEREIARRRTLEGFNDPDAKVKPKEILAIFKDRPIYLYIIIHCAANAHLACVSSFLPVILQSFGFSTLVTQLLTIPIFIVAAVVTIAFSIFSDRIQQRAPTILGCFIVGGAGWLILLVSKSRNLSFAGCFLIAIGVYPVVTINQVWCNNNTPGFTRKSAAVAAMLMIGQVFSIIGTQVYSDPPYYYRGNGFALGLAIVGGIATICLYLDLKNGNAKKRRDTDTDLARQLRPQGLEEIGNKHPDFFYYL